MATKGIKGKEVTPYLLKRINELTEGESSESNVVLIKSNATLGGEIAVELCKIDNESGVHGYWNTDLYKKNQISYSYPQSSQEYNSHGLLQNITSQNM